MKYESGRVADPDRIFFDLPDTRLVSTLVGKSFDVQDGFLKKIRVAQYQHGSTRVVLEVDDVTEYSAFLLPNPYRLIIDIHGRDTQTATASCGKRSGGRAGRKARGCRHQGRQSSSIRNGRCSSESERRQTEQKAASTNAAKVPPSDAAGSKTVSGSERSVHDYWRPLRMRTAS